VSEIYQSFSLSDCEDWNRRYDKATHDNNKKEIMSLLSEANHLYFDEYFIYSTITKLNNNKFSEDEKNHLIDSFNKSRIVKFTSKLDSYAKTINLISGRINQMNSYISTREKIAKNDEELKEFLAISGYRYEALRNTLEYIKQIWSMTKEYVSSAQKLFNGIKSDVTSKSIDSLTIVTSMGAGASIIGLLTESAPTFTIFGVLYFFALALLGWGVTKILSKIAHVAKYEVSDIEYEKNIK